MIRTHNERREKSGAGQRLEILNSNKHQVGSLNGGKVEQRQEVRGGVAERMINQLNGATIKTQQKHVLLEKQRLKQMDAFIVPL